MTPDEMAAKTEPAERQSGGAAAGFDDQLEQLPSTVSTSLQPDLHGSEDVRSRHLSDETSERRAIYDRLQAIESAITRRRSRGIFRYLVAMAVGVGIGVAATLGWQSYGEITKQIIATKAPELGWSPETKQMITGWIQQLGWTKQPAGPERTDVQSSAPETPQTIPKPSPDQAAQNTNNEQIISNEHNLAEQPVAK